MGLKTLPALSHYYSYFYITPKSFRAKLQVSQVGGSCGCALPLETPSKCKGAVSFCSATQDEAVWGQGGGRRVLGVLRGDTISKDVFGEVGEQNGIIDDK